MGKRSSGGRGIRVQSGGVLHHRRQEFRTYASAVTLRAATRKMRSKYYKGLCDDGRSRFVGVTKNYGLADEEMPELVSAFNDFDIDPEDFYTLPPGEEGRYQSHEGGEEVILREVIASTSKTRVRDTRDRRDRRIRQNKEWADQMPALTDAYARHRAGLVPPVDDTVGGAWQVLAVDTSARAHMVLYSGTGAQTRAANVVLLERGYLGVSPLFPRVALSLSVLESFHEAHLASPRLSVQAQVKALCRIHKVRYAPHLASQFRVAYDVFLAIRRNLKAHVDAQLHRNTPNWRMLNVCPSCLYRLYDEPELHPAMLVAMDGNQSLKLVDDHYRRGECLPDMRDGRSDIWIPEAEVDLFKDEVEHGRRRGGRREPDEVIVDEANIGADANDWEDVSPQESDDECTRRWKSAAPEEHKRMFALFTVTGIFISICRHGHLLTICDMVRSGELMKYPLATLNRLINIYKDDFMCGYDINCALAAILARSSLGPAAAQAGIENVVPAFHGHAHNRECQLDYHPSYREGAGKEEFEGNERTFSLTNNIASTTRFATPFHRHQAIDELFKHIDEQKMESAGQWIFGKYKQALDIIAQDGASLAVVCRNKGLCDEDFERFINEEREYLQGLKHERGDTARTLEYMDALQAMHAAKATADAAYFDTEHLEDLIAREGYNPRRIAAIKGRATRCQRRFLECSEAVRRVEVMYNIHVQWDLDSEEYRNGLVVLHERRYQRALDKLERLLVSRMFELTKLGMNGIGYKMREKITKALKTRATAVHRALNEYNKQAVLLTPPREQLQWAQIVDMVTLGEFTLLRDTDGDVTRRAWAQPVERAATAMHFNVKRAREEISRLNIEIQRLVTFMYDDHEDHVRAIHELRDVNPALAYAIQEEWQYRTSVYQGIASRLRDVSRLPKFSGSLQRGHRIGRPVDPLIHQTLAPPPWVFELHHPSPPVQHDDDENNDGDNDGTGAGNGDGDDDDERTRDLLLTFVSNI